jgi:hypothetical protein
MDNFPVTFYFTRSLYGGFSWSPPIEPAGGYYRRGFLPDMAIDSMGVLHIVWLGWEEGDVNCQAYHIASSDGGINWEQRNRIYLSQNLDNPDYPEINAKGDSLVFVCKNDYKFLSFRSFDGGMTWQDSTVVDSTGWMSQSATLASSMGRLHYFFANNYYDDSAGIEIFHTYSDDFGLSWGPRIPLSTMEPLPGYCDSQIPSACADGAGHLACAWMDFKYGSYGGMGGEILARVSTDNGASWLPESRVTTTQSGDASSCLIRGDTIHLVWSDFLPYGISNPKLTYSYSADWSASWTPPEIIAGPEVRAEYGPSLFEYHHRGIAFLGVVFDIRDLHSPAESYFIRDKSFFSKVKELPENQDVCLKIEARPSVILGATTLLLEGGGQAQIEIYDIAGRKVAILHAEDGKAVWEAKGLGSGVYFARVVGGKAATGIKLIYLK